MDVYFLTIILLFYFRDTLSQEQFDYKLVQINVVYRHGCRYPWVLMPKSQFPSNVKAAELNQVGMMQMYRLGTVLRERYIDGQPFSFLSGQYNVSEVLVNSSSTSRSLSSAYCQLAATFPPVGNQIWNDDLLWQPIPVYTKSVMDDPVCNALTPEVCASMKKTYENEITSAKAREIDATYQDFFRYVDEMAGYIVPHTNLSNAWEIFDNLQMEEEAGILSAWANYVWKSNITIKEQLSALDRFTFHAKYLTGVNLKLVGGLLLGDIIKNMNEIKETTVKAFFYSEHDEKLTGVLHCFGMNEYAHVPVASALVFELYQNKDSQDNSVRLAFRNSHGADFTYLDIPGCGTICALSELESVASKCIPKDWKSMCSGTQQKSGSNNGESDGVGTAIVGTVLLLCIVFGAFICYTVVFSYQHNKSSDDSKYQTIN